MRDVLDAGRLGPHALEVDHEAAAVAWRRAEAGIPRL
jgi:hypothetical protein